MKVQISVASSGPPCSTRPLSRSSVSSLSEKRIATVASAVTLTLAGHRLRRRHHGVHSGRRAGRPDGTGRCMLNGRSMVRPYRARPDVGCVAHHHGELLRTDLATNRAWDYYAARAGFQ